MGRAWSISARCYLAPPALPDLFSGQVSVILDTFQTMAPHAKAGKIRMLAVTSKQRWSTAPDVPTVSETVAPGFTAGSWIGVIAPAGTPKAILDRYSQELAAAVNAPEVRQKLIEYGIEPVGSTPEQFNKLIADESQKWGKLIAAKHITLD